MVAVDYSGRFIDAAMAIQAGKRVEFGEGQVARLPADDGIDPARVTFKQVINLCGQAWLIAQGPD